MLVLDTRHTHTQHRDTNTDTDNHQCRLFGNLCLAKPRYRLHRRYLCWILGLQICRHLSHGSVHVWICLICTTQCMRENIYVDFIVDVRVGYLNFKVVGIWVMAQCICVYTYVCTTQCMRVYIYVDFIVNIRIGYLHFKKSGIWVMPLTWMRKVPRMDESCHAWKWVVIRLH